MGVDRLNIPGRTDKGERQCKTHQIILENIIGSAPSTHAKFNVEYIWGLHALSCCYMYVQGESLGIRTGDTTHMHTYTFTCTHAHVHMHTQTHMHAYAMHTCAHTHNVHVHMHD